MLLVKHLYIKKVLKFKYVHIRYMELILTNIRSDFCLYNVESQLKCSPIFVNVYLLSLAVINNGYSPPCFYILVRLKNGGRKAQKTF